MFLRSHTRVKDGKQHRYFSVVESVRNSASRHPYQKTLLYLGEINAEQEAQWTRSMATFDPPLPRPVWSRCWPENVRACALAYPSNFSLA